MELIQDVDVVVVGAGVLGLAVTDALLRSGVSVVCLESGVPGGRQSAGETRIFRHAYRRRDVTEFAQEATMAWDAWSQRHGTALITPTGSLLITDDTVAETAGLASAGVPFDTLAPEQQSQHVPWRSVDPDATALFEPTAGTILARETVQALTGWVGDALRQAMVLDVRPVAHGGVVVRTTDQVFRAGSAVVCAGAELPRFATELDLDVSFTSHPHTRGVFRVRDEGLDAMAYPSFRDKTARPAGAVYSYSLPLSAHEVAVGIEPADNSATFDPISTMQDTVDWVRTALPGLDPDPVRLQSCDSTALRGGDGNPWESEGMGIWRRDDVLLFAGGHYFKFAPLLGQVLAQVALGAPIPSLLDPETVTA